MKTAVVTGASSGIGLACSKKLCALGYRVYGVARDFDKCDFSHPRFVPISCDLRGDDLPKLSGRIESKRLQVLIHAAGVGHFAPHENLHSRQIEEMVTLNLTAVMLLDRLFLRRLKQNRAHLFYIASISGIDAAPMGAVYGATKAALSHYAKSLFRESRKSGLKVTAISPDITKTPFFDGLGFAPTEDPLTYIEPEDIAEVIASILSMREGSVVTEVTIEPQQFRLLKRKRP